MLKRLTWFVMGTVVGAAATLWALTFARAKARQLAPVNVAGAMSAGIRSRLDDLRDAIFEGRLAMHEREAELRAELDQGQRERDRRPALAAEST